MPLNPIALISAIVLCLLLVYARIFLPKGSAAYDLFSQAGAQAQLKLLPLDIKMPSRLRSPRFIYQAIILGAFLVTSLAELALHHL